MEDKQYKKVYVPVEAPKVEPAMIVRTIVFVVAIINSIAIMFGFNLGLEVNQEMVYQIISGLFLIGSGFRAWDRNNDYSEKARKRKAIYSQVEEDEEKED